ncbi:MAG: SMP-30/gluconolactonase/LRE family protein [Roseiflexaceae bacterium]|nr:SMP-30/gluconolactonase/LRE family protein [Roseiflexaceae bacterium]
MKLKQLIESGDPIKIAGGFTFTEGPVWLSEGALLFSDIPESKMYRWQPGGSATVVRAPTGNGNGLTLDQAGRVLVCEHSTRRVVRLEPGGGETVLAERYGGQRLNSPNDIVVADDGAIYFTDPPYGIAPEQQEQPHNGVYRLAPSGELTLVASDMGRPNGLAFSPDRSVLYVDDSQHRNLRAFDMQPDGSLANGRVIADMDHPQPGSPDGMKVDCEGHLYVTGATGVWVFEQDGTHLGVIATPERPSNLAWGDADRQTLYVTARTSVYTIRTKLPGDSHARQQQP